MTDVKKIFSSAVSDLEEDDNTPIKSAIRDLIRVERNYYYSSRGKSGKLREIRDIIGNYSLEGDGK